MNPLQFCFFLAIFIDDYFFKEGKLTFLFNLIVIVYTISYFLSSHSKYHNSERNLRLASYSQSEDCTVYGKLKFKTNKARIFLKLLRERYNKKINWTIYFTKVVSHVFLAFPEINAILKYGAVCNNLNNSSFISTPT